MANPTECKIIFLIKFKLKKMPGNLEELKMNKELAFSVMMPNVL